MFADVSIVNGSPQTYAVSDGTGSAEYEGPAVGLYVDRTSGGGTTIYESGDFTATVILRATFGTGDGNAGVEGDVTNFRSTQHGAKNSWHVELLAAGWTMTLIMVMRRSSRLAPTAPARGSARFPERVTPMSH